jgi:uncharacterized protein YkwD
MRTSYISLPATVALALLLAMVAVARPSPASADPALDSEEQAFITLINDYRAQNGRGPLTTTTSLQNAADWMSEDMGVNAYFSHTDSLGRSPWARMSDFGYSYNTSKGENIAAGYTSAQSVFDGWRNSTGHNANMLNSNYVVMGIARVYIAGSPYGWYWTNDFGGYDPPGPPQSTPTPTPSPTPSNTPPPTATPAPTPTASPSPAPTATRTPTPAPSPTHTPSPSTSTPAPTQMPEPTATPAVPDQTPTDSPTLSPTPTPVAQPMVLVQADNDCSENVDAVDALKGIQHTAAMSPSQNPGCPKIGSGGGSIFGDVDCDGAVDAVDALKILQFLTAIPSSQNEPCTDISDPL